MCHSVKSVLLLFPLLLLEEKVQISGSSAKKDASCDDSYYYGKADAGVVFRLFFGNFFIIGFIFGVFRGYGKLNVGFIIGIDDGGCSLRGGIRFGRGYGRNWRSVGAGVAFIVTIQIGISSLLPVYGCDLFARR